MTSQYLSNRIIEKSELGLTSEELDDVRREPTFGTFVSDYYEMVDADLVLLRAHPVTADEFYFISA